MATTGITIDGATYARSAAGRAKLKNDFAGDIANMIKVLGGDKYATFKKTVNANWVGPDADDFLSDVDKTRNNLVKKLNALKTQFNAALDDDAKQFSTFQAKNIK